MKVQNPTTWFLSAALGTMWALAPAHAVARQADPVLQEAAAVIGADNLMTLRYVAAGSTYTYEGEDEARVVHRVAEWLQTTNLGRRAISVSVVRASGTPPVETHDAWTADANSGWDERIDQWLVPQVFLEQAEANGAGSEPRTVNGVDYTVVSFDAGPRNRVEGFIEEDGTLRRVHVRTSGDVLVETSYMYYEASDGIRFPGLIIRKRDGKPDLILSIKEVEVNPADLSAAG